MSASYYWNSAVPFTHLVPADFLLAPLSLNYPSSVTSSSAGIFVFPVVPYRTSRVCSWKHNLSDDWKLQGSPYCQKVTRLAV